MYEDLVPFRIGVSLDPVPVGVVFLLSSGLRERFVCLNTCPVLSHQKVLDRGIRWALLVMKRGRRARMEPVEHEERRESRGGMRGVVVRELCEMKVVFPVRVHAGREPAEVLEERAVDYLRIAICLWVVATGHSERRAQLPLELVPEFARELGIPVADELHRQPVASAKDVLEEQSSRVLGRDVRIARNEHSGLSETVDEDQHRVVSLPCHRQVCDVVHRYRCPRRRIDRQRFQEPSR